MIDFTVFALRSSYKFCQLWPTDECSEESETESSEESPTSEICIEEMMVTPIYLASVFALGVPLFSDTVHTNSPSNRIHVYSK
jgi:hypothetical protein